MYTPWDEREERRKWAREVLSRLGFGLARDESGFYRPEKRVSPRLSKRSGRRPARPVLLSDRNQLKIPFPPDV